MSTKGTCENIPTTLVAIRWLSRIKASKPKVISEALGHASVAFTMDTYSHIIEGMQSYAMALLDEVLPPGYLVKCLIKQS